MDILSRRVYQGCVWHVSVTSIIASTFSRRALFITRPIKLEGGNGKQTFVPVLLYCICCKTGFHAIYWRSWWHSLEANRSIDGVPKTLVIFRKTFCRSLQSNDFVTFLDSQSALTFNLLGRYSAVIVIWWDSRYYPTLETPLQYAPQLFVETSVWMIIWDYCCWAFLQLQSFKFSIQQSSSSLAKFPSVTWRLQDPFFCRANICSCWKYQNWIQAGKMARTVDYSRLINFVRFKTEVFGCLEISWHCWDTCFNFSFERA